jgi:hypothetical protein
MGKSQRTKGHNFERETAVKLREIFPEARRGLQYQDGKNPPDVVGTPFHIECKVGKKPNPRTALEQAITDSDGSLIPVAVIKDDRREPFIVMQWNDFFELVREWNERSK